MSALPETCGACEHAKYTIYRHDRPNERVCTNKDSPVWNLDVRADGTPPLVCPLRRAEELRREREAGQTEGAEWMLARAIAIARSGDAGNVGNALCEQSPATVCAEARDRAKGGR